MKKEAQNIEKINNIAISVKNLTKRYHKCTALNGLTLDIHAGQIIGLIGANGSGKTTFFRICNGLLAATEGSFSVLGGNPLTDISTKNEMIYSMHNLPVGNREKIKNILSYYTIMYPHFDREFADKILSLFEVNTKKTLSSLSQGTKSLVHFACAMATRCQMTMLDEPFIGIDIEKRKTAYEILLRDYMEHPRTFLISSHNLSELEHVLSEMILIHNGNLIFYEDMDAVRDMLIRVDGEETILRKYLSRQKVLHVSNGEIGNFAIVEGSMQSPAALDAQKIGLTPSPVNPEDVCIYLTSKRKESDLECLWN